MEIKITPVNFYAKPDNYGIVDKYVSRSAQPKKEDLKWLKEQGVTDIFNFRTMFSPDIDFDEAEETRKLGMQYHSIPSITKYPLESNVNAFLKEIEDVKSKKGKAHIHCKAGADRTGMYAFIYKMKSGKGNLISNMAEWFGHGYHYCIYPNLIKWAKNFVKNSQK